MNRLTIEQLQESAVICGLPQEYIRVLIHYFPDVEPLIPEYMERYYQAWPDKPEGFDSLFQPEIEGLGPERTHALYISMILAGVERSAQLYRERGYPLEIWREIMPDLRLHVELAAPGFLRHRTSIWWSYEILSGYTVQLGRLQFQPFKFYGRVQGYRHDATGEVVLLTLGGDWIDGNGFYAEPGEGTWQTEFQETAQQVIGHPVRNGRIQQEMVRLDLASYRLFLDSTSDVMIIHIPEGRKMDMDECRESFRRAVAFYRQYFPNLKMKGFICLSWLLDVQLQEILDENSNIMEFQRSGYLYPLPNAHSEALKRVFGSNDIGAAEPETRLQKGILNLISSGKKLRDGGIFIPLDNMFGED